MKKQFRSFKKARKFAQTLRIRNQNEWRTYAKSGKLPDYIPRDPPSVYKNEWIGWSDFFGNESRYLKNPPTIKQYKKWVQSIGIKSEKELRKLPKSKLPKNYPKNPEQCYKKQGTWKGWSDLFGKKSPYLKDPPTIEQYKKWLQKIGVKSEKQLKKIQRTEFPNNYPKDPKGYYKRQGTWKDWSDLFGNDSQRLMNPPTIKQYKEWLQSIGIKTQSGFRKIPKSKFPKGYPKDPSNHYGKQGTWQNWSNLTGTESHFIVNPPTYDEYKQWLQSIGIKSLKDLRKIPKFPKGYPKDPYYYYKKQGTWKSYGDFFGTGNISPQERSKQFLSFEDARKQARILAKKYNIKSWDDWKKAKKEGKIPDNIPWAPNTVYSKKRKK